MRQALRTGIYATTALFAGLSTLGSTAKAQAENPAETTVRAAPCQPFAFEGANYTVCTVDPKKDDLRLFWRDGAGKPYRSFSRLEEAVEAKGEHLAFAINAGMYSETYAPVGLHIEEGQELSPADRKTVEGPPAKVPNFYKRPNGVFFIDGKSAEAMAGVVETEVFLKRGGERPRFATQSGPMLVIGGKLHPAFIEGSSDRTWRSGVGVCEGGVVRFAVSDDGVNFHDFARLFRDGLKCPDALFLDGGRGVGLYDAATGRSDWSGHGGYGPILGLVEAGEAE